MVSLFVFVVFFICFLCFFFFFFFSSRRRHTRWNCDWEFRRVLFRSATVFVTVQPPPVQAVALTDGIAPAGQAQRSQVRDLLVTFAAATTLTSDQVGLSLLNAGGSGTRDRKSVV